MATRCCCVCLGVREYLSRQSGRPGTRWSSVSSTLRFHSQSRKALPRFYVDGFVEGSVVLEGKEAQHATKVLRLKPLDEIEVCDGRGGIARCTIRTAASSSGGRREREKAFRVTAAVESVEREPWKGLKWVLCVAGGSVKGQRGDWLVEKATELGAWSFQPLLTDHSSRMGSQKRTKGGDGSGREERWKRLAMAASKQCLRSHILDIRPATDLDDLLAKCSGEARDSGGSFIALAAHQSGRPLLPQVTEWGGGNPQQQHALGCLIIGPEGDFSERELEILKAHDDVKLVGLGDLRLRVETAALALLSGVRILEEGASA
ncbi:RNA methyltransferase [Chloropicon primus]|uniref:16S rRNA (uracil(1498)-N(3))-methyltransferase n=1 Tax=Chloropicon primus TaxID=1764295 RepID=A0A5B8MXZ5_9CHLO|nr:RNA methyltransferase [Chloropicon primus]UPR04436.1 RNA methyltransferase [Chloropicon primus]|eukprot:QDZ25231.1 RNA methyltransferase [Chloropicon primus]